MNNLEKNLFSKHRLTFGEDGKFRILMLSDIQETLECDARTIPGIRSMLDRVKPDLVLLGGDNCNGKVLSGKEDLEKYIKMITEPFEAGHIPFAHIFGNHDHDMDVPQEVQQSIYESFDYCVSKHTEADVSGKSNFVLPVFGRDGTLKFCLWGLDSNNRWKNFCRDVGLPEDTPARLDNSPRYQSRWDIVRFDQLMWYYNSSVELEKYAGHRVDGMLALHVEPHEFTITQDNPEARLFCGTDGEKASLGGLNSGLFATVLERGDVRLIASAHLHRCDYTSQYLGVRFCLDACAGFSPKGDDALRGGRVFELTETNSGANIDTYMVRALEGTAK